MKLLIVGLSLLMKKMIMKKDNEKLKRVTTIEMMMVMITIVITRAKVKRYFIDGHGSLKYRVLLFDDDSSQLKLSFIFFLLQESQEEHHSALLNTMASQTMTAVSDLEQSEQLGQEEAKAYVEKLMKEVKGIKENYEKERRKQEEVLHKKLSEKKKKRMQEKV